MTATELLDLARQEGITLSATPAGNLRWRTPASLSAELLGQLAEHKYALLALVDSTADELERFEERAAIAEHDGRLARADAERLAWQEVQAARTGPKPVT